MAAAAITVVFIISILLAIPMFEGVFFGPSGGRAASLISARVYIRNP
jgi:hypothetical protein